MPALCGGGPFPDTGTQASVPNTSVSNVLPGLREGVLFFGGVFAVLRWRGMTGLNLRPFSTDHMLAHRSLREPWLTRFLEILDSGSSLHTSTLRR